MLLRYCFAHAAGLLLRGGLVAALAGGFVGSAHGQVRVLFVGNSFTHGGDNPVLTYNRAAVIDENAGLPPGHPRYEDPTGTAPGPWGGVPGIFKKFTAQAGLNYEVHLEAISGTALQYHYDNALTVIRQSTWDRVVLQEHSLVPLPVARGGQPALFASYATQLEQAVHAVNPAAQLYLYQTWARADLLYLPGQPYSGSTAEVMTQDLQASYNQVAATNGRFAAVAPVGDAWLRAIQAGVALRNPFEPVAGQLNLWAFDNSHASVWGSYLSACVLFGRLTGRDPRTLGPAEQAAADLSITPAAAAALQAIAYQQLASTPQSVASSNKTYGPSPLAVQFTGSNSTDPAGSALTYLWNFGDGTTSTAANPAHTFTTPTSAPTAYHVTLTVTNSQNLSSQAAVLVAANNTPPQVTITSPANNSLYPLTGSTVYQLRAAVTDAEHSGHLLHYAWQTLLHHQTHVHPGAIDTTRQTSTTVVPYGCGTEAYYYEVALTVTDEAGLATTQAVRLNPDCATPSFTLVDADTPSDADIQPLVNGTILDLATLPTRSLNIRANADPAATGSMVLTLSGTQSHAQTENVPPYALFSDDGGDYYAWTPPVGNYTLSARPYAGPGGSGPAGPGLTVSFTVIDSGVAGPFSLTTAVFGSGTIATAPSLASYPSGTTVTLSASPATGFVFTGWSGSASGTTNPLTVSMTANKSITATFSAVSAQQVTGYTLVNADTDADIQPLAAGAVLNLATLPTRRLNLRANTSPAAVGSVVFGLSGAQTQQQTESTAPYALFSDNAGDYFSWTPAVGSYTLQATPFAGSGGTGTAGTPLTIGFSVVDQLPAGPYALTVNVVGSGTATSSPSQTSYPSGTAVTLTATPAAGWVFVGWSGGATGSTNPLTVTMSNNLSLTATFSLLQQVTGFVLVNADTDADIQPLAAGAVLNLATLPAQNLNIRATTNPATVGSVVFNLGGAAVRSQTESVPPYALFSDDGGDYYAWTPAVGSYTLQATPFAGSGGTGASGTALELAFSVVNEPAQAQYTLTANSTGGGTVSKSPNQTSYPSGSTVTLAATPAAGYQFRAWSGAATGSANPLTLTMSGNLSLTAGFVAAPPQVSSFTLVNASTEQDIQPLPNGAVLNLSALPTRNLNVRANTSPSSTGSVVFRLTGTQTRSRTDNTAPYSAFGDTGGNYSSWTPAVGSYALQATPYPASNGGGTGGTALRVSFSVVNQAARPAAAPARGSWLAEAYPNPSADGRFRLRLPPDRLAGPVRYQLLSPLGATLASGTLPGQAGAPELALDFSRLLPTTGCYYLLLANQHQACWLKLLRE